MSGYREDPRWVAAQQEYLEPKGDHPDEDFIKRITAAKKMRDIEVEYE